MRFTTGNRITPVLWTFLITVILGGCVTPPASRPPRAQVSPRTLPAEPFWWGISTSPYQNEDRGVKPGSPEYFKTDWDLFAEEGKAPPRGENAVFSWTHFRKDIEALKKIGVTHYRFGVEWARVEPQPGRVNETALKRYVAMARELKAAGIEPVVTLWHFTFPGWAYDAKDKENSNFLHPDIPTAWKAHVARCVNAMKPYVRIWVPQNEPNGALPLGYLGGYWPPGLTLRPGLYKKAMKISAEMFRDAAGIIRRQQDNALIMGAYSVPKWRRNWLHDPTALMYNLMQRTNTDQLDMVYDVCDLIGVNYYYTQEANIFGLLKDSQGEISSIYTQLGWRIRPQGMHEALMDIWQRYQKPIIVTENGLGTLSEQKKIRYFREHISQMRRAMAEGADVRGYFAWTLVDNYEWQEGWNTNFGLTHFDPLTKERIIEPAGIWYREYIRKHRHP
jgi:beta-glucosidase